MTGVSPLYLATDFGGGEARGERERERERGKNWTSQPSTRWRGESEGERELRRSAGVWCGLWMSTKYPFRPGVNAGWSVGAGAIVGMGFLGPLAFSVLRSGWWGRPRGGRLVVAPSVEATVARARARLEAWFLVPKIKIKINYIFLNLITL